MVFKLTVIAGTVIIPALAAAAPGTVREKAGKRLGVWRSLVAHLLWEQGVGGSNPSTPTS